MILSEAKADQEAFIAKFGKEAFDFFQKYGKRLLNNNISNDLTWHIKNTQPGEMQKIINDLFNKVVKDNGKTRLNRELVASKDGYDIYLVKDWQTAMNMGDGTQWCIAGRYNTDEVKPSQAKQFFPQYKNMGINQYYFMKDGNAEYCVSLYPEVLPSGRNYQIWDKKDEDVSKKFPEIPLDEIPGIVYVKPGEIIYNSDSNGISVVGVENKGDITFARIKDGAYKICENAFLNCYNLEKVAIPDSVKIIMSGAFCNCFKLNEINLPKALKYIGQFAFSSTSLRRITLSGTLVSTGVCAFCGCSALSHVVIEEGVTTISSRSFTGCTMLKFVKIPSSLRNICSRAFENCVELHYIIIPETVTKIDSNAFVNCADDFTIIGSVGSAAEKYALENGIKFRDINKQYANESFINEVYPNKGETKKDFISRFMKVTKKEYPDIKQRFAVALSYWNRKDKK